MSKNFRVKNGLTIDAFSGNENVVTTLDASGNFQVSGVDINSLALKTSTDSLSGDVSILKYIVSDTAEPIGFVNRTDSTLSYNESTRELSLSGNYIVYTKGGIRNEFSGESDVVDNTDGIHFYYYDDNGDFVNQLNTPWDFEDDAMVAVVWIDSANGKGILFEERHGIVLDWATHRRMHLVDGTAIEGEDFIIGGVTLSPSSPTNVNNQPTFTGGNIHDEDILVTLPSRSAGNYTVMYRSGSSGTWRISDGNTVPLLAATYAQYNEYTGSTWQLTSIGNGDYINMFVFITTAVASKYNHIFVPGQQVFDSLGEAEAEGLSDLDFGNIFPLAEVAPAYKITFRSSASYGTIGKVRIEEISRLGGRRSEIAGVTPANIHNALSGLQGGTLDEYYHLTAAEYSDYISSTEVADISGNLQNQISDNLDSINDLEAYDVLVAGVTDDHESRITDLEGNAVPDIFRAEVADISGNLQNQISDNLDSISDLEAYDVLVANVTAGLDSRLDDIEGETYVNSVNSATGDLTISGAGTVSVSTDGSTISISGADNSKFKSVVSAFISTSQTISNDVWTTVNFGSELIDKNNDFSSSIFTAPEDGTYYASFSTTYEQSSWSIGTRAISIISINNSTSSVGADYIKIISASDNMVQVDGSGLFNMSAGDTLRIKTLQNSGTSKDLWYNWNLKFNYLQIFGTI